MTARMAVSELAPATYKAMLGLSRAADQHPLPKPLVELVRLRASQINGCAYCVDMHSTDAKAGGEADARVFAVAVWREAPFFSAAERAALDLTEAMCRLSEGGERVGDEVWQRARAAFSEAELAALVMSIVTINAWNLIGVATRLVPESYKES